MLELVLGTKQTPKSRLTSVKRIKCYISGTLDYGLWYPYDSSPTIAGYFDANWVGNVEDKKNISGACFFSFVIVSWLG